MKKTDFSVWIFTLPSGLEIHLRDVPQQDIDFLNNVEQLRAKVAELETALREAKEALLGVLDNQERGAEYWSVSGGVYEAFECNSAIKSINKVLGEE